MARKEKDNINIAILGAGTVGGGVYKLIDQKQEEIRNRTGAGITVKKVLVRNADKDRPGYDKAVLTSDWNEIVNDPDIDVIVELMGGIEPARTYIIDALKKGKQIVTANKDLIAECDEEVLGTAESMGSDILFEATVAGAIPS